MNIERRRRWIEQIWQAFIHETDIWWDAAENFRLGRDFDEIYHYRKRLLSLLRRVRRCPECGGIGFTWEDGEKCPTCGGTGKL